MDWRWLVLAVCSSCSFPPLPELTDAQPADGATDGATCVGDRFSYRVSNVDPCSIPTPTSSLTLTDVVRIDTFAGTMTSRGGSQAALPATAVLPQSGGPAIRVVSVTGLTLPATDSIVVAGDADLAGTIVHAAGSRASCTSGSGTRGTGTGLGGGGGGGALGAMGGAGGGGNSDLGLAGAAGLPLTPAQFSPLAGGCAGSAGNNGSMVGAGGGGLQVSATGTITVSGTVTVPGGGGGGGGLSGGGGGGGSGGLLLFEAGTRIAVTGTLAANGGGGGGGAGNGSTLATDGFAGGTGSTPAFGGTGGGAGAGLGGNGGAGTTAATAGNNASYAGGGGGGSVGLIWLRAPSIETSGASTSPSPRTLALP